MTAARRLFTLVEMAIVVAIIAILGAIAMPALAKYQYAAKQAEVEVCLDGILKTVTAYDSAHDADFAFSALPLSRVGNKLNKTAWPFAPTGIWLDLGWEPDRHLYGGYGAATCTYDGIATISALMDVDDDDVLYRTEVDAQTKGRYGVRCVDESGYCDAGAPPCF